MPARLPLISAAAIAVLGITGCAGNNASSGDAPHSLTVKSSATSCTVSAAEAPAGAIRFTVANTGDQVTEFYLLRDDKKSIAGEVENVGPGLSRDLTVQLDAGTYYTSCKPGMQGDGVGMASFTVTP